MKLYFPDTNFFFECRKAADLPWHELEGVVSSAASEVRLIVPSAVITEIDRHKQKGNSRTARRAREASALLRQAVQSADHTVEVRSAVPRVTLSLPPVLRIDPAAHPNLDHSRADHRIILEYLQLVTIEPNLRILTDDTLLILAARSVGLDPLLIPEGWKLGAEKDERDDELDQLKAELNTFKQNAPVLAFTILDSEGTDTTSINVPVPLFELSDEEIETAAAAVATAFPMATNFREKPSAADQLFGSYDPVLGSYNPMRHWRPPRQEEIEHYKKEAYPNWRQELLRELPRLARRITDAA
ncbi:PIN domain-containing protein [Rhodoplanes sp. SY1]|uniref:PIN domain-containing protein n=1 Tax=Rhodoplanes sp. SY1 TaxID=3166646 RepID=UPI0038B65016